MTPLEAVHEALLRGGQGQLQQQKQRLQAPPAVSAHAPAVSAHAHAPAGPASAASAGRPAAPPPTPAASIDATERAVDAESVGGVGSGSGGGGSAAAAAAGGLLGDRSAGAASISPAVQRIFQAADRDGDGLLSFCEVGCWAAVLGVVLRCCGWVWVDRCVGWGWAGGF